MLKVTQCNGLFFVHGKCFLLLFVRQIKAREASYTKEKIFYITYQSGMKFEKIVQFRGDTLFASKAKIKVFEIFSNGTAPKATVE